MEMNHKAEHAREFKKAYENDEIDDMFSIVPEWIETNVDDSNLTLALILLVSQTDKDSVRMKQLWNKSFFESPDDEILHEWYRNTAQSIIEGFSDDYNDNDYARDFLYNFKKFIENVDNHNEHYFINMERILAKWKEDFPDDANYTCAYVIANILEISEEEITEYFKKVNIQHPIDEMRHAEFLQQMTQVTIMRLGEDGMDKLINNVNPPSETLPDNGYGEKFVEYMYEFESTPDMSMQEKAHDKMENILEDWGREFPDDANYTCAYIIINILDLSPEKLNDLLTKLENQTPLDEKIHEIMARNMDDLLKIRQRISGNMTPSHNLADSSDRPDGGFARQFMELYNRLGATYDFNGQSEIYDEMKRIVGKWGEKYPDDSNYVCAYIIANIQTLSEDEISQYMNPIPSMSSVDRQIHDELFAAMAKTVMRKKSASQPRDYSSLDCSDFSKEFKMEFEKLYNTTNPVMIYSNLDELLENWKVKCPDDENLAYADIIVNFNSLTSDDIKSRINNLKYLRSYNLGLHSWFLSATLIILVVHLNDDLKELYKTALRDNELFAVFLDKAGQKMREDQIYSDLLENSFEDEQIGINTQILHVTVYAKK